MIKSIVGETFYLAVNYNGFFCCSERSFEDELIGFLRLFIFIILLLIN
jgi:hypothetical protein